MRTAAESASTWRGWGGSAHDGGASVTSTRLDGDVVVARWFPKVRSWFALGAPLELLSPLSVARVVVLAGFVTWPVAAIVNAASWTAALVCIGLTAIGLAHLLSAGGLSIQQCRAHALVSSVLTAIAAWSGTGQVRAVVFAPLLCLTAVLIGLFLSLRWVLLHQIATTGAIIVVVVGDAATTAGVAAIGLTCWIVALTTVVTTRSARFGGAVDPETGLPNPLGIAQRLNMRMPDRVLVATVHLQGISEARAALGHAVATELLRRAVEDLGQVSPTGTLIGRGAGDDLVLVLPQDRIGDTTPDIFTTLHQLESAFGSGRYLVDDIEVGLTPHVGYLVADRLDEPVSATELLRRSALAAESARAAGASRAAWDGSATTLTVGDLRLLADLRTASSRNELWLAYQPKISTVSGAIVGLEALMRWTSPIHGVVAPGRFIPLAERTGLVDRLTEWALGEALDAQVRWRGDGHHLPVSVNVSPLSLRSLEFGDTVLNALSSRALPCEVLVLEVTESAAFDVPEAVERLGRLHSLGVRVSIDDFGTGYTSLSLLPTLPIDELKLDQQFVLGALTSPAHEAITRSVAELGRQLGFTTVAEGVETEEIAELMGRFGFHQLQGYHFFRPLPEAQLIDLLAGPVGHEPGRRDR
jgi:diguanylate cyclase